MKPTKILAIEGKIYTVLLEAVTWFEAWGAPYTFALVEDEHGNYKVFQLYTNSPPSSTPFGTWEDKGDAVTAFDYFLSEKEFALPTDFCEPNAWQVFCMEEGWESMFWATYPTQDNGSVTSDTTANTTPTPCSNGMCPV